MPYYLEEVDDDQSDVLSGVAQSVEEFHHYIMSQTATGSAGACTHKSLF
jgi:hypothetical protein